MSPPLHQPHDHLFRLVFADPEETAAFLRARLPDSYQRGILWSSLSRAPGSFVDQELRGSVTDLLFEVRSAAAAPRQWLYLLFEHQSQPDRWMALRLLRYCCRIWEADRRDTPTSSTCGRCCRWCSTRASTTGTTPSNWPSPSPRRCAASPGCPASPRCCWTRPGWRRRRWPGSCTGGLLQLAMMHTFEQELGEARKRIAPLLGALQREPVRGGVDYYQRSWSTL